MLADIDVLGVSIQTFGLFFGLNFLAWGAVASRRLGELGRPSDWAYELVFVALGGGLVGAKLYWVVDTGAEVSLSGVFTGSGLTWYGGLLGGALAGAAFGFSVGLLSDLALMDTLGITSLVLLAVGYWCGRAREVHALEGPLVPLVAGALATLVTLVGFSVLQFLLGADPPLGAALLRQITATLVLNALLAVPVHWLVTRATGGSLVASRPRRRRAYTTGGLSPLYSRSDGPISR
ncbi:MAG: rod shape-determining protein MreD [Actinobacteria bacterium]|nr:rod shape-determining protein MreD [Actinomycetota bacterium]